MTNAVADACKHERTALVIGHPGHELRVHHWLERTRPVTFVLTDGSGHSDHSRIDSTTQVLAHAGARRGAIYGALTDRALYQAILRGDHTIFAQLAQDLAAALQRERATCVVGDAAEGVNPGHDVCRLLINAALALIARTGGRRVANMEFPVEGPPGECPPEDRAQAVFLDLDDAAYARKLAAARAYPELAAELERVFDIHDAQAFRVECIRPVRYGLDIATQFAHPCVYERYGETRVAAGIYRDVVRFRDVAQVAAGLAELTRESRSRLTATGRA
jgi:hypothetical protein